MYSPKAFWKVATPSRFFAASVEPVVHVRLVDDGKDLRRVVLVVLNRSVPVVGAVDQLISFELVNPPAFDPAVGRKISSPVGM